MIPKIGVASDLAIKIPNSDTEEWYLSSVNRAVDHFHEILQKVDAEGNARLSLVNIDLDTGDRVKRGDYPLADQTYTQLLARLASKPERTIPADIKRNILDYFAGGKPEADSKQEHVSEQLEIIKKMKAMDGLE